MRNRSEIIRAARSCVGARFRPHGRDPTHGLDCAGVAGIAFARPIAGDYALRGGDVEAVGRRIAATGLRRVSAGGARPGDLVLLQAGPGQLHLAVLTDRGFVHADARLRRVVETPGEPAMRVLSAWAGEEE